MDGYKNAQITVTPGRVGNGPVKWELEIVGTGKKGGPANYPVLEIPAKQKATKIKIEIINPEGFNYKFAKDANALWVSTGTQDPTGPSSVPSQIPVDKIKTKDNDTELEFVNLNQGAPVEMRYTLNFVDQNNQTSSTLDPIIRNGGSGGPPQNDLTWAYIVGGAILAALLVVGIRKLMDRQRAQQG
jgi:hypothetical protein